MSNEQYDQEMTAPNDGKSEGQMEVDSTPNVCADANAYFGTKRYFHDVKATNPPNI